MENITKIKEFVKLFGSPGAVVIKSENFIEITGTIHDLPLFCKNVQKLGYFIYFDRDKLVLHTPNNKLIKKCEVCGGES